VLTGATCNLAGMCLAFHMTGGVSPTRTPIDVRWATFHVMLSCNYDAAG